MVLALHPPLKEVLILPLDASSLSAFDIAGERCEIYGENLVDDRLKAMSCHGYSYARLYVRVVESTLIGIGSVSTVRTTQC